MPVLQVRGASQFTQIIYILSNHIMLLLRVRLSPVKYNNRLGHTTGELLAQGFPLFSCTDLR
jgi:hypothetical protein